MMKKCFVLIDTRANGMYSPYPNLKSSLNALGIRTIEVSPHPDLYSSVAAHPDLQIFFLDEETAVVAPGCSTKVITALKEAGISIIYGETPLRSLYPQNIAYNVAKIGKFAFHNLKFTDPVLKEELHRRGVKMFHVNQGYTKCSVMVVDENAIITEDHGIFRAVRAVGIEALLLAPGFVRLPGLPYGLIGGAGGKKDNGKYFLCGSLSTHPQGREIKLFLQSRGVELRELWTGAIYDLGSLLFFG